MKNNFLQIAGVATEKEFYKKYPTEDAFFAAHPEAAQMKHGGAVDLNAFYNQPRFVQTNIFAEGGDFSSAPVNTFMSPGTDTDPRFEQYYNQQLQAFTKAGVKQVPSRNDIYSYYQSSAPTSVVDQTGRMMFNNPTGKISASSTFSQAVDPMTGKPLNQGTNLQKSAFDQQAMRFDDGGELAMFQFAGEFLDRNPWMKTIKVPDNEAGKTNFTGAAPVSGIPYIPGFRIPDNEAGMTNFTGLPPVSGTPFEFGFAVPNQQVGQSNVTGPAPVSGVPVDLSNTPAAQRTAASWQSAATYGAAKPAAPVATKKGTPSFVDPAAGNKSIPERTFYMQPVANTQMFGDKTYRSLSNNAMLPIYNPAIGMLSDNGLSGMLKMGLGAISGLSGMATGLDNVVRGFKGRKEPGKPRMDWNDPNNAKALYQEPVQQEMMRKQQNELTPPAVNPAKPVIPIPNMQQMDEFNRTAAYGGMIKAEAGIDFTKNPAIDPSQIRIGNTQYGADVHGGITRAMGANAGVSMFNNALGYQRAMKQVRENTVKAGMTDFGYQPDDTNWMPMGYDTLNTGPGQTQAPNLYTPVQYAGMQTQSQFQEGGEYDLTEEEIAQILAAGGEIEFM